MTTKLSEVMTTNVKVTSPDASLREAAAAMRDGNFGMLPVGDKDRLLGVLTDRDIAIRAVAEGRADTAKVRDVMSAKMVHVYDDETVERAASLMSKHQVRRLPVMNRQDKLVGIVALGDFAVESADLQPAAKALREISEPSKR